VDPPAGAQDRPCLDAPVGILFPDPGTKSAPVGFFRVANSTWANDLRAAKLSSHNRQLPRGALAGHAPPTEHDGACNRRDACELNLQRHSNV
jgi:hypothetical protein